MSTELIAGLLLLNVMEHTVSEPHDWHMFDEERGYEVSSTEDSYFLRDRTGKITELTPDEFEQLRAVGPNPKGLR